MNCEFCNLQLADLKEARRHMLTAAHMRSKQSYDLSIDKTVDRHLQATLQPRNIKELLELLNIRSSKDVDALYNLDFFKIERSSESKITRELIMALRNSEVDYRMSRLPVDLRTPLEESIYRHCIKKG